MIHVMSERAAVLNRVMFKTAMIRSVDVTIGDAGLLGEILYEIYGTPDNQSIYHAVFPVDELLWILERQQVDAISKLGRKMCLVYIDNDDQIWYADKVGG